MIKLVRTNAQNTDFVQLVKALDAYLTITDGDEHDFYDQYNQLNDIKYVIIAYENGEALGCGAIKQYLPNTMEIKRMYTNPAHRGKGIASQILEELENWAEELGAKKCILETGIRQPEAIALYQKNHYQSIPNYGQYKNVENSICFEKILA